jgi:hypothetical protein
LANEAAYPKEGPKNWKTEIQCKNACDKKFPDGP